MVDSSRPSIVAVIAIALIAAAGWLALFAVTGEGEARYVRVDNACVLESGDEDMPYEYALSSFDGRGAVEAVTFKTERELRDGAYLLVRVLPVRGVVSWEEVREADFPQGWLRGAYGDAGLTGNQLLCGRCEEVAHGCSHVGCGCAIILVC